MKGVTFNILHSKVELRLPLSQLHYDAHGFKFKWNEVWLAIPYEPKTLKIKDGHLLEEFKNNLKGEITICLHWHRIFRKIEGIEVMTDESVSAEVADITSRIEQVTSEIQPLAATGTLTLDEARIVLAESGFKYNDEKIHRILSEIVNNMPPQQIQEEVEVPLVHLQYSTDGIKFSWGGVWFQVLGNKLPFETGPALENVKSRLDGNITFHIEKRCLVRWDSDASKLWVGRVTEDVSQAEIDPDTLSAFKELRGEMICNAIDDINRVTLSLDEVESILKEWGLDLNNQESGERIASSIPPWTEERRFRVAAKDVIYSDSSIKISLNGKDESVPARALPFETSAVLERIKEILEGNIEGIISQPVGFIWSETKQQLTIGQGDASYDVTVEDKLLERIKYVHVTYEALVRKFGQPKADVFIVGVLKRIKPEEGLTEVPKNYDAECVRFLAGMADDIYETSQDLWFKIGNLLIWERPEYGAATYIFDRPKEPLRLFICGIWGYELLIDIQNDPESGYRDRVFHDTDDVSNWKRELRSKIQYYRKKKVLR